jgi:hypothetical protein
LSIFFFLFCFFVYCSYYKGVMFVFFCFYQFVSFSALTCQAGMARTVVTAPRALVVMAATPVAAVVDAEAMGAAGKMVVPVVTV